DHQRQGVQAPGPRYRTADAVGGLPVSVESDIGDAVVVDEVADHGLQLFEATPAALADALCQLGPGGPDIACRVDEFVVSGDRAAARVEQRLLSPGGAIAGQQVVDVVRIRGGLCHQCRTVRTRR